MESKIEELLKRYRNYRANLKSDRVTNAQMALINLPPKDAALAILEDVIERLEELQTSKQ